MFIPCVCPSYQHFLTEFLTVVFMGYGLLCQRRTDVYDIDLWFTSAGLWASRACDHYFQTSRPHLNLPGLLRTSQRSMELTGYIRKLWDACGSFLGVYKTCRTLSNGLDSVGIHESLEDMLSFQEQSQGLHWMSICRIRTVNILMCERITWRRRVYCLGFSRENQ